MGSDPKIRRILCQRLRGIGAQIEKVSDEKEIQKFILKVS